MIKSDLYKLFKSTFYILEWKLIINFSERNSNEHNNITSWLHSFIIMGWLQLLICLNFSASIASDVKYDKNLQPDSIDVIHYSINLNITDFTNKTISGNTIIMIVSKVNNLNVIKLDFLKLTIDSVIQDGILISNYYYNDTLIKFQTQIPLFLGDSSKINIYYHGIPAIDQSSYGGGFYFVSGYAYNIGVAFKDYPHNYGRAWFPCKDNFYDRSTYDFYITVKNNHKAVCGGTLKSVTDNGNNTSTWHWNLKNSIPTYLASVAVGPYKELKDTFNGMKGRIPISLYVYPGDTLKAANSFINLKLILSAFEQRFGPYKWERVGYVETPFTGGAMEHATNIAYPSFAIDGTLNYESGILAHELSHHWFGDLVTCSTDKDMWLNEGWGSFCESICRESLYGNSAYKDYVRANHNEVLRYLHIGDSAYRAVWGVPPAYTYSSTVYNKGADVAHSLRGYLGDSLFFKSVKSYLNYYSFNNASSEDLKNILSDSTGINMQDFFDFHVYSPGFTHYSVDSFIVVNNSTDFNVTVYVRQKLKGTNVFANSNKVEITFMDSSWNQHTVAMQFSGQAGNQTFTIPINPVSAMIDLNEKISDATTDFYKIIKSNGTYNFVPLYFQAKVSNAVDSAFIRVTHNWVAPDNFKIPSPNLVLSKDRYWKVEGIIPKNFVSRGWFYYDKKTTGTTGYLDNNLIKSNADSLVLLYRKDASYNWKKIKSTKSGSNTSGYLYTDTLKTGEYAFARKDTAHSLIINSTGSTICHGDSIILHTYSIPGYNYQWLKNDTILTGKIDTFCIIKQTGLYSVIIRNNNYSDTCIPVLINVISIPKPLITQSGDTLTSNSAFGNQWYLNGIIINGATYQTLVIDQTGNYQLVVKDNDCYSSMTDSSTFHFSGISNYSADKSFINIYPNPNKGNFIICLNSPMNDNYEYTIINILGMELFRNEFSGKGELFEYVNLTNYSSGINFINIQSKNGMNVIKMLFFY